MSHKKIHKRKEDQAFLVDEHLWMPTAVKLNGKGRRRRRTPDQALSLVACWKSDGAAAAWLAN